MSWVKKNQNQNQEKKNQIYKFEKHLSYSGFPVVVLAIK